MRKKVILIVVLLWPILCLCSCEKVLDSTFSIQFIDVGQGDSALIGCDGRYMLIDGGDTTASDKVYRVLEEQGIQELDILAISHLHADHIGGLPKALTYTSKIDKTISNRKSADTEVFRKLEHELYIDDSQISVPNIGDKFELGSAQVEVIDNAAEDENDSLVLLITYGKTRFLFTGDIEDTEQKRIADKYTNQKDEAYKIDVMKIPHHGASSSNSQNGTGALYRFIRTFMPDYGVISVGTGNPYGHPQKETLDLLKDAGVKIYRTDVSGDITIKSDGKHLSIETSK